MEKHSRQIESQDAIEIQTAGNDPKHTADQRDRRRSKIEPGKKLSEIETNGPIKPKVDNPFEFARLVGRFYTRGSF